MSNLEVHFTHHHIVIVLLFSTVIYHISVVKNINFGVFLLLHQVLDRDQCIRNDNISVFRSTTQLYDKWQCGSLQMFHYILLTLQDEWMLWFHTHVHLCIMRI